MPAKSVTKENLSREFRVVLAGLQAQLKTAPTPDWSTLLTPELDWALVLGLCQFHEVTPLVYESLKQHDDKIPAQALASLKQQVMKDTKHSLHLAQQLQTLLALFQSASIEVFPYKGITLAQQSFGDIAKRPTKDLDLVVQTKDYERTRDLLRAQGFAGPFTSLGKLASAQQEKLLRESSHHHVFRKRGTEVELHFEIMPPSGHQAFTLAEVWPHLEDKTFGGYPIKAINPDLYLFILSTHAAIHYWKRLKWLFDAAWLLDQGTLSGAVLAKAKTTQRESILLANAELCRELLALPMPDHVTAAIHARPTLHKLSQAVLGHYQPWPHTRMRGSLEFRCRSWLSDTFNPGTVVKLLGHKLISGGYHYFSAPKIAYVVLNPLRLTARYVSQLFRSWT